MKKINSPVESFPGYVVLPDPLTYPDVIVIQKLLRKLEEGLAGPERTYTVMRALFPLIKEWGIEGYEQDPDSFPATGTDVPLNDSRDFIDWLVEEFNKLFNMVSAEKNE